MSGLALYFFLSLCLSFLSSLMESTILAVSPAYVSILEKGGHRSGFLLHKLHSQIDRPLAAILTMNIISNTVGSMMVAQASFQTFGDTYFGIISGVMSFIILVFAEIIPKTLGAIHAKRLAPMAAYFITFIVYLFYPMVFFSRKINQLLSIKNNLRTSREEMIATAEIGVHEGVIHSKESQIIKNLMTLDTIEVHEVMTPRSVVQAFNMNETVGQIMDRYKPVRFSRIPLHDGNLDNIQGLLHRYKLMEAVSNDRFDMPLKDIITSIHSVNEATTVSAALDQFIKRREHLFLVVNDHNLMTGIVTLEDTIETLLGVEIVDEYDSITDMRQYAIEQWRLKKQALIAGKK